MYTPSLFAHLYHLEEVLKLLREHKSFAKLSKLCFGLQEVEYLGHIVSSKRVAMDKKKVQVFMEWPFPTNFKPLRGVLGLTRYYRRLIRGYASIASPLTQRVKEG